MIPILTSIGYFFLSHYLLVLHIQYQFGCEQRAQPEIHKQKGILVSKKEYP
jgi:hypothetical protein